MFPFVKIVIIAFIGSALGIFVDMLTGAGEVLKSLTFWQDFWHFCIILITGMFIQAVLQKK